MTAENKPLHGFALFLWAFAAFYVLFEPVLQSQLYLAWQAALHPGQLEPLQRAGTLYAYWSVLRVTAIDTLYLITAGIIVELVDSIRWAALSPDERTRGRRHYLIQRLIGGRGQGWKTRLDSIRRHGWDDPQI